jgi:hypothetical protein
MFRGPSVFTRATRRNIQEVAILQIWFTSGVIVALIPLALLTLEFIQLVAKKRHINILLHLGPTIFLLKYKR